MKSRTLRKKWPHESNCPYRFQCLLEYQWYLKPVSCTNVIWLQPKKPHLSGKKLHKSLSGKSSGTYNLVRAGCHVAKCGSSLLEFKMVAKHECTHCSGFSSSHNGQTNHIKQKMVKGKVKFMAVWRIHKVAHLG